MAEMVQEQAAPRRSRSRQRRGGDGAGAGSAAAKMAARGRYCQVCRAHRPRDGFRCPHCGRRVGKTCPPPEGPCWDYDHACCIDCVPEDTDRAWHALLVDVRLVEQRWQNLGLHAAQTEQLQQTEQAVQTELAAQAAQLEQTAQTEQLKQTEQAVQTAGGAQSVARMRGFAYAFSFYVARGASHVHVCSWQHDNQIDFKC